MRDGGHRDLQGSARQDGADTTSNAPTQPAPHELVQRAVCTGTVNTRKKHGLVCTGTVNTRKKYGLV